MPSTNTIDPAKLYLVPGSWLIEVSQLVTALENLQVQFAHEPYNQLVIDLQSGRAFLNVGEPGQNNCA